MEVRSGYQESIKGKQEIKLEKNFHKEDLKEGRFKEGVQEISQASHQRSSDSNV